MYIGIKNVGFRVLGLVGKKDSVAFQCKKAQERRVGD